MAVPGEGEYWIARFLFRRGLAVIYLLAFLVAARQFRPLAGEDGILPLDRYVDRFAFSERPSLFYFVPSDRAVGICAWTGVGLSALGLVGAPNWFPAAFELPATIVLWTALWALYLSFVNAGQLFYGYGWESMLLETGFLAIFLGSASTGVPVVVVWLVRWVLFRNMFGAGLIKLRGDRCWRELTCLEYHYETQPIPNPLSWFAHHLPDRFHRAETLGNHLLEVAVPFLYFAPQPFAALAGLATVGFQGWLVLTGNFSWLNALTIVLATSTFGDDVLALVPGLSVPAQAAVPPALQVATVGLAVLVLALSVRPTTNLLSERQRMNTNFDPLNLVNTYGAFGSVTKTRYELVIEGTDEETLTDDTDWKAYEFPGKPTDPARRPRQIAPYHLRLDWQLWFAAMTPRPRRQWFGRFLEKLLAGEEAVKSLLAHDPFPDGAPTYVRVRRYRYRYTTPEERAETGRWWHREPVGTYVGPVSEADVGGRVRDPQRQFR